MDITAPEDILRGSFFLVYLFPGWQFLGTINGQKGFRFPVRLNIYLIFLKDFAGLDRHFLFRNRLKENVFNENQKKKVVGYRWNLPFFFGFQGTRGLFSFLITGFDCQCTELLKFSCNFCRKGTGCTVHVLFQEYLMFQLFG